MGGIELTAAIGEDAQARVLLAGARAPAPAEPGEQRERDVAERVQQRDERGEHERGGVEVDRQRLPRAAVGQARARARDHRSDGALRRAQPRPAPPSSPGHQASPCAASVPANSSAPAP